MKLFKNLDKLSYSLPAKPSKRFVACVIDMVIVFFVSIVVFSGIFRIVENTTLYRNDENIVKEEIDYYNNLVEESHIVEFNNGIRVDSDIVVMKNLTRAIYLSYSILGNSQQPNFDFPKDHPITSNDLASLKNDSISYFYTQFIPLNNDLIYILNGSDAIDYLVNVYKKAFGNNFNLMFTYDKKLNDLPVLNTQVAYCMFYNIFISEEDNIGETGKSYYDIFFNSYRNMLIDAEDLIVNSEPYNSNHYQKYIISYCNQARYVNVTLIISIIISYLIAVLLPKYVFKNERSIGYLIMGLGVINNNKAPNKWYIVLIKSLFGSIGFLLISFMRYLTYPFNGVYDAMFLPIKAEINLSFSFILLIICLLGIVINIVSLFSQYKQNILNFIFNDFVVDSHYIDDDYNDYEYRGRSY